MTCFCSLTVTRWRWDRKALGSLPEAVFFFIFFITSKYVCICFYFNTLLPVFVEFEVNFKQEYLDNFMPLIIIFFFSLFYKLLVWLVHPYSVLFTKHSVRRFAFFLRKEKQIVKNVFYSSTTERLTAALPEKHSFSYYVVSSLKYDPWQKKKKKTTKKKTTETLGADAQT